MRMHIRCWDSHLLNGDAGRHFETVNETERGTHDRITITTLYIQSGLVGDRDDQLIQRGWFAQAWQRVRPNITNSRCLTRQGQALIMHRTCDNQLPWFVIETKNIHLIAYL